MTAQSHRDQLNTAAGAATTSPNGYRVHEIPTRGIWTLIGERNASLLIRHSRVESFRHAARIIEQGATDDTDVLVLLSGVALVVRESRRQPPVVLAVRGPGDLVGELAGWSGKPRSATVLASGRVDALRLRYADFATLLNGSPRLVASLAHTFAGKLDDADRRLIDSALPSPIARTARLIDDLVRRYGELEDDGTWIVAARLTRNDLAQLAGLSKSSIERSLRLLLATRVADVERYRIVVNDRAALRCHAQGGGIG